MNQSLNTTPTPTWKRLIIYSVSFLFIFFTWIAIDLACGAEEDPYDYYVSFFHNNIQGERNYGAFYLSNNLVFSENEPVSEADINAKEWASYLGSPVTAADVKKAMYGLSAHDDSVINEKKLIAGNKLPDSLNTNTFLKALQLPAESSALQYYQFVKNIEKAANPTHDSWDPRPVDSVKVSDAGAAALVQALAEEDTFLKLRYFYQAQRLLHFSGDIKGAMAVYDGHINHIKSDSHIKGWALSLKAGEERRMHDTVRAAYLFSKVFAQYPERRVQAYRNYNFCRVSADQVVSKASGSNEKAFIYAIEGFGRPGMDLTDLQKVYDLAPRSEAVGVLLTREINKLEQAYLTSQLNAHVTGSNNFYRQQNADSIHNLMVEHIKPLQDFCDKVAADNKFPEQVIIAITSAYLDWLEGGHADEGLALLNKYEGQLLSDKVTGQKALVMLLLTEQKNELPNAAAEMQLLPSLKWLDTKVAQQLKGVKPGKNGYYEDSPYDKSKFAMSSRDFYKLIMAEAYFKQKDTIKAALCILKSEKTLAMAMPPVKPASTDATGFVPNALPDFWLNYLHSNQVTKIIALKRQGTASLYLKFLSGALSKVTDQDLYDLLGTTLLREHDYVKAVNVFRHVSSLNTAKTKEVYVSPGEAADPFINQLLDYPKTFVNGKGKTYDKAMFAQEMESLQNKIKTDPKNAANYYFRMATGFYNASHYGNAYYLISYNWSSYDYGRAKRYSYDDDYINTVTAGQYYLRARELSAIPEFEAKCTFMAAKCKQKQIPAPEYIGFGNPDTAYSKAERNNPYFAELEKNYSKTAFYKQAVNECSFLKDFLKGEDKK
jgi:hypothetical protein